ncbi:Zinc metalloprotease TldD [Metallosphaera sp. J1]|uniref:TldD/PmbA family protein n=1 Tax=Metallosphaera TaxID=41980 RepID=UPI001EDCB6C6|nr:TldD/PmbA family protein [Metallosphaera javensis (ex Hofmann et al. 2022)]MCG3109675.1 Zinc metalloprotease TldD [Metallosphaera javensis (ex Hofmann et al. 2022)]BCS92482.1 MAG: zinc metalloprotease TldD [Metallosphaera javensis (ex Sakai et al. 2022)]
MTQKEDELESIASKFPFKYVEVRHHQISSRVISLMNGELLGVYDEVEGGYSVRYFNGALFFASSQSPEELNPSPERVSGWSSDFLDVEPENGTYQVDEKTPLTSVSLEEKIALLKDISKEVLSQKIESKLHNFVLTYSESVEEKEILINGSRIVGRVPRILVSYNLVMSGNGRTITAWHELGESGGLETLRELKVGAHLVERVKALDRVLQTGKGISPGRRDVVLSPILSGIMAHESVGHPFEADRVLGREFAQAGTSYLATMNSRRLGNPAVNVADDPTIQNSMGYYQIDDEGVKARRKLLIREGEVNELLQNRFTAKRNNVPSNGSARASGFDREPLIRMSNTFFVPGDMNFRELIEDVKEGIFFKTYMEWNIDDMRMGQRYIGLEAYEIRRGEIGDPVLFPVLEGKTTDFLSAIDGADDSLEFYPGTCGKGDPDQGIPVSMGGPDLRLRNVMVKVI